eukprot:TRINITY_DN81529_c0_g1_i1.p1 TRINITY_DN81529_c0_g1~~TRINITY_DN81529_c0_g1_i1.p1  ORF type:complete len:352 (+),score=52.88 TRINITY_DN81529_c0_g1_i1:76-1131(+)
MALFSDAGAHCSVARCQRLDFLPFKCDACHRIFCLDHFRHADHACAEAAGRDNRVIVCPLCQQAVPLTAGEDPNVVWQRHEDSGACRGRTGPPVGKPPRCPVAGCKEALTASGSLQCGRCGNRVCLRHRFEDSHACVEKPLQQQKPSQPPPPPKLPPGSAGPGRRSGRAGPALRQNGKAPAPSKARGLPGRSGAAERLSTVPTPSRPQGTPVRHHHATSRSHAKQQPRPNSVKAPLRPPPPLQRAVAAPSEPVPEAKMPSKHREAPTKRATQPVPKKGASAETPPNAAAMPSPQTQQREKRPLRESSEQTQRRLPTLWKRRLTPSSSQTATHAAEPGVGSTKVVIDLDEDD